MRRLEIHHIGIAVSSESRLQVFSRLIGNERCYKHYVPAFDCYCIFSGPLEFIIPASTDSVVYHSIRKRGEGLHHIAVRVDDVATALKAYTAEELVDTTPKPGAGSMTVVFVRPRTYAGVLVELVEEPDSAARLDPGTAL